MTETPSSTPQANDDAVKNTAKGRARYTRDFFEQIGLKLTDFINTVKQAPFNIEDIDAEDDQSLTNCVYRCQKAMGFPDEDNPLGCDARFGRYTLDRFNTKIKTSSELACFDESMYLPQSKPPDEDDTCFSPESLAANPDKLIVRNELDRHYEYDEMYTVGDSLMLRASQHVAEKRGIDDRWFIKKKYAKGGRRLVDHNNSWDSNEERAMVALDQPDCNLLVLSGGSNDLNNTLFMAKDSSPKRQQEKVNKCIDQIIASHKKIIKKAHSFNPPKEVVIFTIPFRRWGSSKWMTKANNGYELLKEARIKASERIFSEVPADMILNVQSLTDEQAFGRTGGGDGIHWRQAAADYLMTSIYEAK